MLYTFKTDTSLAVTPYCETMTDNYYWHVNKLGLKGVESLGREKMQPPPYTDAFLLRYHAKKVDYITAARLNFFVGWLITEKMLDVLLCFRLPEYSIYDAWVEHRKKRYPYKIFHFLSSYEKFVDFQNSSFYITNYLSKTKQRIYVNDEKNYHIEHSKLLQHSSQSTGIRSHKLYLVDEQEMDVDIFKIGYVDAGIFLKQNLVDALRASNITGIVFEPISFPIKRHIVWADTGLPVED